MTIFSISTFLFTCCIKGHLIDPLGESQASANQVLYPSTVKLPSLDILFDIFFYFQTSLQQLQKAIKGLVVMSLELDKVYTNFLNNQVSQVRFPPFSSPSIFY